MTLARKTLALPILAALACWSLPASARGCTIGAPGTTQKIAVGDTGRSLWLHVPGGFSRAHPAPLVFGLHGSGQSGEEILKYSRLAEAADRHGFILAAPDGGIPIGPGPEDRGFVWNIPGVPSVTGKLPTAADADDVAFLRTAIDWLAAKGCVDRTRVYATGISGGGRMTSWLGCVASDKFAAIAPVVGLRAGNPLASDRTRPDPATCAPKHPMPVITFAGDRDTVNPPQGGGAGYWQYPMAAAEQRWAELNGCRTAHKAAIIGKGLEERLYTGCRGGADVSGRIVAGRGHEWVADNDAMWAFFARHRRR